MSDRTRLLVGLSGLAASASLIRRDRVGPREVRVFQAVNGLPDVLFAPVWVVMQGGALGAVPVAAALARARGRPALATRLLTGGSCAWALAKAVKRGAQRPRPVVLVPDTHCRGNDAPGLGYVSGHVAVVVALTAAALPHLGCRARALTLAAVPGVGMARMYVGAHLPLDVLGGAALGLTVDAAVAVATGAAVRRAAQGSSSGRRHRPVG